MFPSPPPPSEPDLVKDLEPAPPPTKETIKIRSWIRDQLVEGGFPDDVAGVLCHEPGIDYRLAVRLLKASRDIEWTVDQLIWDEP